MLNEISAMGVILINADWLDRKGWTYFSSFLGGGDAKIERAGPLFLVGGGGGCY